MIPPQRGMPFRPPMGSKPPAGMPSRAPLGSPFARPGVPSRMSSPLRSKSAFGAKKPMPQSKALGNIFQVEGGYLDRKAFGRKFQDFAKKNYKMVKLNEQKSKILIENLLPYKVVGGGLTASKMKQVVRKMEEKAMWAPSFKEKKSLKMNVKILKAFTRVK